MHKQSIRALEKKWVTFGKDIKRITEGMVIFNAIEERSAEFYYTASTFDIQGEFMICPTCINITNDLKNILFESSNIPKPSISPLSPTQQPISFS